MPFGSTVAINYKDTATLRDVATAEKILEELIPKLLDDLTIDVNIIKSYEITSHDIRQSK